LPRSPGADSSLVKPSAPLAEIKPSYDPFAFERRPTPEIDLNEHCRCGGEQTVRVVVTQATWDKVAPKIRAKDDVKPEAIYEELNVLEVDPTGEFTVNCETQLVSVKDGVPLPAITAFRLLAAKLNRLGQNNPILLKDCLSFEPVPLEPKIALLRASAVIGSLLADGIGDAILIRAKPGEASRCDWRSISCRRPAVVPSKPITWLVLHAAVPCLTCKPSPPASKRAPSISKE